MSTLIYPVVHHDADLRRHYYNATIRKLVWCNDELLILRVVPDEGIPSFLPGQYTVLGLGTWEPCAAGIADESESYEGRHRLITRLYSISCSLLDEWGRLAAPRTCPYLEFYIRLVRPTGNRAVTLTPRLFALKTGQRLYCSPKARGHYTLENAHTPAKLVFAATGTGEAPHNAMIADRLTNGFRGPIICVTCVRKDQDLAYHRAHRELERRFPNYRYLALTTREPRNLDASDPGFVGKRYLQDYFASGELERDAGIHLSPRDTEFYLCGSPDMIGYPKTSDHPVSSEANRPPGMVDVLAERGFTVDRPSQPGNIHIERYW